MPSRVSLSIESRYTEFLLFRVFIAACLAAMTFPIDISVIYATLHNSVILLLYFFFITRPAVNEVSS